MSVTPDITRLVNRQWRLARRPVGLPTRDDWRFTEQAVGAPDAAGGVLLKTLALSLDPAMRGWMNEGKSYIAPVGIDEVMRAGGIGVVLQSYDPSYAIGDKVSVALGVQAYASFTGDALRRAGAFRIDPRLGTTSQWLNLLGMPGMTGYFGLLDIGRPLPGQTVVVSGAAGAVGQAVGQLAKIKGCRAVGIAGGPAKCDWVVRELGFDACIDYKAAAPADASDPGRWHAVRDGLKRHCPDGVDVYFDNVGGDILDAVLARLARKARIVLCGAISQYNATVPVTGPSNYLSLLVNRARMEGMVVFDYADRFPAAIAELAGYLKADRMKSREDVVQGLDAFPEALLKLFSGANIGKLVLQLATD